MDAVCALTGDPVVDGPIVDANLSDKLSDLIDQAIADYKALDHGKYYPNSDRWHKPAYKDAADKRCSACLAGAVIANTFKGSADRDYSLSIAFGDARQKLLALDLVRQGYVLDALVRLDVVPKYMTLEQRAYVDSVDRVDEDSLGDWADLVEWRGWDGVEAPLANLAKVAAGLRAVGL